MNVINWIIDNSTIILVIASIAGALATIYYAITNHKLWQSTKKERQRPKHLNEVNFVIKPFIDQVDSELRILKGPHICWYTFRGELLVKKFHVNKAAEIVLKNFFKKNPKVEQTIKEHDDLVLKLEEIYNELVQAIKDKESFAKINEFVKEFEQNPKFRGMEKIPLEGLPTLVLYHILEKTDLQSKWLTNPFKSFWGEYGKIFLDIRKEKDIEEYLKKINQITDELIKTDQFLAENLQEIFDEYIIKYNISLDEIEAKTLLKGEFESQL